MLKNILVQLLVFILVYPFLFLISILPFRVFYIFSDVVYVLVYYIIGYRKKVVTNNLKLVFPEKDEKTIREIRKKFYKHMCDMFLEMIKSISISNSQLNKRFIIKNPEEINRLEALDKSIIVMYGHYASYEWSFAVENYVTFKGYGIYKPIANKYFDNLIKRIRSKFGTTLIPARKAIATMTEFKAENKKSITAFLSDQTPKLSRAYYWQEFLGINVPCFIGAEMLAKKLDHTVVYLKIEKVKRGHYEAEFVTLAENPSEYKDYDITDKFTKELEKQIYKAPEYYLWTHKRWKHKDNAPKDQS